MNLGMCYDSGETNEWGSDQEQELATSPGTTAGLSRGELAKIRNRQAQRRFRERQKEKMKEARKEYERLQAAKESLSEENARLTKEALVKTKVFMVRNTLADLYESAYSRYRDIKEREGSTPMLEECHASESDQGGSCMLKSLHDSGQDSVSGASSVFMKKIPMPQFIEIRQQEIELLKSMKDYEDIYAEFHKRCLDLKSKYLKACETREGNDAEEAAATRSLDSLFWHACRFRPELAIHLLCAHCCCDDQVLMQLAEKIYCSSSKEALLTMRSCYRNYSSKVAKIGVRLSLSKEKLESITGNDVSMAMENANSLLQLHKYGGEVADSLRDEFIATLEYFASLRQVLTENQLALAYCTVYPNVIDPIKVSAFILHIDRMKSLKELEIQGENS
eukprot:jgi/Picsp_1/1043/NSC_04527-R1_---NA---